MTPSGETLDTLRADLDRERAALEQLPSTSPITREAAMAMIGRTQKAIAAATR